MQQTKEEIDALLAEETGAPSIDNYLDRRFTCRFFGHSKLKSLDNYKGGAVKFCLFCGAITHYWSQDRTGPEEMRAEQRKKKREWKKASGNEFLWEYLLSEEYSCACHPESK